jgi:hypothetical protein
MAKIVVGKGKNRIEISPELEETVDLLFRTAFPVAEREMKRSLAYLEANAKRKWPVRTGVSRDAIQKAISVAVENGGIIITGSFYNDVFYARFVRTSTRTNKKKPTGKQLEYLRKQALAKASGQKKGSTSIGYHGGVHAMTEFMRKPFEQVEVEFEDLIVREILGKL